MSDTAVAVRLVASFGALAAGVVAAVVVGVLGHRTPGPEASAVTPQAAAGAASSSTTASAAAPPTSQSGFPRPPSGAVVFSREDGGNVLALGVVPGKKLGLQASVVGPQGNGVRGLGVSFGVGGKAATARPCGPGCYSATVAAAGRPRAVEVRVRRGTGPTTRWVVPMPKQWPPHDATSIVARATRTYRNLRTFRIHDRLASDATHFLVTKWRVVAPDRLAYRITKGGPEGVIIGARRWDRVPGATWQESAQTPIHQPTPFWVSWQNAHVLSATKNGWRVSFFDPRTPGWYQLTIARSTLRPLEMFMDAKAHFMHDVYSDFNAPIRIRPPR